MMWNVTNCINHANPLVVNYLNCCIILELHWFLVHFHFKDFFSFFGHITAPTRTELQDDRSATSEWTGQAADWLTFQSVTKKIIVPGHTSHPLHEVMEICRSDWYVRRQSWVLALMGHLRLKLTRSLSLPFHLQLCHFNSSHDGRAWEERTQCL